LQVKKLREVYGGHKDQEEEPEEDQDDLSHLGAAAPPVEEEPEEDQDDLSHLGAAAPPVGYQGRPGQKTHPEELRRYVVFYIACRQAGLQPWSHAIRVGWATNEQRGSLKSLISRNMTADYLMEVLWPTAEELGHLEKERLMTLAIEMKEAFLNYRSRKPLSEIKEEGKRAIASLLLNSSELLSDELRVSGLQEIITPKKITRAQNHLTTITRSKILQLQNLEDLKSRRRQNTRTKIWQRQKHAVTNTRRYKILRPKIWQA
jgi:hypothetical protein